MLRNWGTFSRIYLAVLYQSNMVHLPLKRSLFHSTEAGVTVVGYWSKVDLVALYFILAHYNIFLQKRHIKTRDAFQSYKNEETSVENLMCWNITDSFGGGHISSVKGMSPGSTTLSLSHALAWYTSLADLSFSPFSPLWSYSVLNVRPIFMHLMTFCS